MANVISYKLVTLLLGIFGKLIEKLGRRKDFLYNIKCRETDRNLSAFLSLYGVYMM